MAQHGHFGVMQDGVTLIPPRDGFGTVAIYDDGKVLLVHGQGYNILAHLSPGVRTPTHHTKRQINPHTAVADRRFGATPHMEPLPRRLALGISRDGTFILRCRFG